MSEYIVSLIIKDKDDEFNEQQIKKMVEENMLEYADNAPFSIFVSDFVAKIN